MTDGDADGDAIVLSVVAPVYNEAQVVVELVRRIDAACRKTGLSYEIIIADDCSTDTTSKLLSDLSDALDMVALRHERLPRNAGQWGATAHGLRAAKGAIVVAIDGDLQDPPEIIAQLVDHLCTHPDLDAVFACKTSRDDPAWFIAGMTVFRFVQDRLSPVPLPAGAGAFVAMRSALAKRAAATPKKMVNLAPVLCALGAQSGSVPYEKLARYDNESRVGPWGLAQEAVGSLAVTGALRRLLWIALAASILGVLALAAIR